MNVEQFAQQVGVSVVTIRRWTSAAKKGGWTFQTKSRATDYRDIDARFYRECQREMAQSGVNLPIEIAIRLALTSPDFKKSSEPAGT